jgi:hypothetical protein
VCRKVGEDVWVSVEFGQKKKRRKGVAMAEKTEDSSSDGDINDIRGEERDLETIGQVKSRFSAVSC